MKRPQSCAALRTRKATFTNAMQAAVKSVGADQNFPLSNA